MKYITLGEICKKGSSNIAQKDLEGNIGDYEIYGASGFIKKVDFYHQEKPYIGIVKDGAGVGRTMLLPAKSSVIGTMQYILPNDDIDIRYLYYAIDNMNLGKYYMGAAIPHIYFKDYQSEKLPVRDIQEQKQIADVLAKTDALIADRKAQLIKLDELVKSRFIELFGDPEHNEKQWDVFKLESLCSVGSSKRIYQNELSLDGIPFLRISDLVNRMDTGSTDCELYIPEVRYEELNSQGLVPVAGDILLTARGTLGRCYTITESDKFYFQDGMITWLYDFDKSLTTNYLTYLFAMSGFRKQIDSLQAGSTVAYLSISMTKKLDIMLPPIDLQNQFAEFVEQTDKLKFEVKEALEKLETLKKSLMQQYFG